MGDRDSLWAGPLSFTRAGEPRCSFSAHALLRFEENLKWVFDMHKELSVLSDPRVRVEVCRIKTPKWSFSSSWWWKGVCQNGTNRLIYKQDCYAGL